MARGVDTIDVHAVLQQVVIIWLVSNVFTRGAMLFDYIVVYNGSKLLKRA